MLLCLLLSCHNSWTVSISCRPWSQSFIVTFINPWSWLIQQDLILPCPRQPVERLVADCSLHGTRSSLQYNNIPCTIVNLLCTTEKESVVSGSECNYLYRGTEQLSATMWSLNWLLSFSMYHRKMLGWWSMKIMIRNLGYLFHNLTPM